MNTFLFKFDFHNLIILYFYHLHFWSDGQIINDIHQNHTQSFGGQSNYNINKNKNKKTINLESEDEDIKYLNLLKLEIKKIL